MILYQYNIAMQKIAILTIHTPPPPTLPPTPIPTGWMDGWIDIWKCECLFLASYPISSSTGSSISKLLPWLNRQCRKYCRLNVRLSDVIINLAPLARFPQSDTTLGLVSRSLHLLNPTSTLFTKNSILDLIRDHQLLQQTRRSQSKIREYPHTLKWANKGSLSLSLILAQTFTICAIELDLSHKFLQYLQYTELFSLRTTEAWLIN